MATIPQKSVRATVQRLSEALVQACFLWGGHWFLPPKRTEICIVLTALMPGDDVSAVCHVGTSDVAPSSDFASLLK